MNDASHPLTFCHMTLSPCWAPAAHLSKIKPHAELFLDIASGSLISGWRENIPEGEIQQRDTLNAPFLTGYRCT